MSDDKSFEEIFSPTTLNAALAETRARSAFWVYMTDLQGLSYGRTELLVADMRLLAPDPSGSPPAGRCQ